MCAAEFITTESGSLSARHYQHREKWPIIQKRLQWNPELKEEQNGLNMSDQSASLANSLDSSSQFALSCKKLQQNQDMVTELDLSCKN